MPVDKCFGDSQLGADTFAMDVMQDLYRAPEDILIIEWDDKIRICPFGFMLRHRIPLQKKKKNRATYIGSFKAMDLFKVKHLFNKRLPSRQASAGAHLVRMIELLGPSPCSLTTGSAANNFLWRTW